MNSRIGHAETAGRHLELPHAEKTFPYNHHDYNNGDRPAECDGDGSYEVLHTRRSLRGRLLIQSKCLLPEIRPARLPLFDIAGRKDSGEASKIHATTEGSR
jgi:hypothetical protein